MNLDIFVSVFATYRFIQRHYWEPVPLWFEVRNELAAFKGLMILVSAEWDWQWTPHVFSVDASLSGYGVVKPLWGVEDVRAVGRVSERSRYKLGGTQARAHATHAAGVALGYSGKLVVNDLGDPLLKDSVDTDWIVNQDSPEAPSHMLHQSRWANIFSDAWLLEDDILRLEARSILKAAERIGNCIPMCCVRVLILGDNLASF